MELLDLIFFFPVIIFFLVSAFNYITHPFLYMTNESSEKPKVSLLIPAKNEINRISKCLESSSNQDYPNIEVIVLDDQSDDGTYEFIQKNFPNIRVVKGKDRSSGWRGKNWACQQLSELANGEILVFTDADNFFEKDAISKTISKMHNQQLDFLSIFPQQKNKSISEKIFVPLVDNIVYSLLPLKLTLWLKGHKIAAANGQWIAISKIAYQNIGGHSSVKDQWAEDIQISRIVKKAGYKILVNSGLNIIYTRMYDSYQSIKNGFEKNMYYMLGGNFFITTLSAFMYLSTITVPVYFLYFNKTNTAIIYLAMLLSWKFFVSALGGLNYLSSLIYHPIMVLFIFRESFRSMRLIKSNKVQWKGVGA